MLHLCQVFMGEVGEDIRAAQDGLRAMFLEVLKRIDEETNVKVRQHRLALHGMLCWLTKGTARSDQARPLAVCFSGLRPCRRRPTYASSTCLASLSCI